MFRLVEIDVLAWISRRYFKPVSLPTLNLSNFMIVSPHANYFILKTRSLTEIFKVLSYYA